MLLYTWHAEDAWLASLITRAQITADYNPVAEAEAILAEAPVLA